MFIILMVKKTYTLSNKYSNKENTHTHTRENTQRSQQLKIIQQTMLQIEMGLRAAK